MAVEYGECCTGLRHYFTNDLKIGFFILIYYDLWLYLLHGFYMALIYYDLWL